MGDVEILVPLGLFASIFAIVWVVQANGHRNRNAVQETIRKAIESGQQLTPDTIRALGSPKRQRGSDLRWGIIWLSIAAGVLAFGGSMYYFAEEAFYTFLGLAAFPGFIGFALVLIHVLVTGKDD